MEKINRNKLLKSGKTLSGFKKAVEELSDITECHKVKIEKISFMHNTNQISDGKFIFNDLSRGIILNMYKEKPILGVIDNTYIDEEALKENSTNLLALVTDENGNDFVMVVSEYAMASLLQFVGLSGSAMFDKNNYLRNAFVAGCFYEKNAKSGISLVCRKSETCADEKIYYFGLSRYHFVPQKLVLNPVLDRIKNDAVLGKMDVINWEVTQEYSRIYIEFPDVANEISLSYGVNNAIPGLILQTSDIGRSSLTALSTLNVNGHQIIVEEIIRQHCHRGEDLQTYIDEFVNSVDTQLFANVKTLPKQLLKLIGMDIPAKDLDSENGRENNFMAISDILKEAIDLTFKKFNASKKRIVLEGLQEEICSSLTYSAYDIAALIISVPDRLKCDPITEKAIQKEIAKAPFHVEKAYNEFLSLKDNFVMKQV